jgi:hypothetical protein
VILLLIGFEKYIIKKQKFSPVLILYFVIAITAFFSLALGYVIDRNIIFTTIFLLVACLIVFRNTDYSIYFKKHRKYILLIAVILMIPSFLSAGHNILRGFLLSSARDAYIESQALSGNKNIIVKTPIKINDSHCGLYQGFDILEDKVFPHEIAVHNVAKALYYNVDTITGINTDNTTHIIESIIKFIKSDIHTYHNLLRIIYDNWGKGNSYNEKM